VDEVFGGQPIAFGQPPGPRQQARVAIDEGIFVRGRMRSAERAQHRFTRLGAAHTPNLSLPRDDVPNLQAGRIGVPAFADSVFTTVGSIVRGSPLAALASPAEPVETVLWDAAGCPAADW
jgi:hypothetical protein